MKTQLAQPVKALFLLILLGIISCKEKPQGMAMNTSETKKTEGYKITPVNIQHVKLTDDFWLPIIQRVQEKTISYAIKKCEEEGRMDNFLIAGGEMKGTVKGAMPFDDSDVYKIIEGASNSLISSPNEQLSILLDSLIGIIKTGQEKDGYLTTWRTINPAKPPASWVKVVEGKRWESLGMSHELYNAGHMYEAAAVHYKATGKRNFLDIALKNADLICKTFGDAQGEIKAVPGHEIIETGLIQLYKITNEKKYLDQAKYFLDNRGNPKNHKLYGSYSQDSIPLIDQDEVKGHAVRAVYVYAGMTDIAALEGDNDYKDAVFDLWDNLVEKKMYITGGIGAKHEGEAFGKNYELPNLTAYNETCAAIGDVYWNHRLHNLTGDVKYFDIIERTLYNGLISGLSLDGTRFFYPNALESDGVYKFNQGACTRKDWFDCSCCPTNLVRFIPAIPGLIYSKSNDAIFVNLYASNEATVDLHDNQIKLTQETNYPWDGMVKMTVTPEKSGEFALKLRVPGWARDEVLPGGLYAYVKQSQSTIKLSVNGKNQDFKVEKGYITLSRKWNASDQITINFPMEVHEVQASDKVKEDQGKVSLEYGPIVYAIEEIDNKRNFDAIKISENEDFKVIMENDLLKGVNTIKSNNFKAIPYYAWSNRGVGKMKVWLDYQK